jgi:large subunit ribosomal protein L21
MYAIIQTGGKQYRVSPGDSVKVEKLDGNVGDTVTFDSVLMIGGDKDPVIGTPVVKGASVTGTITEQDKAKKITILKFKRRKGYRKKMGHRQPFTRLRIEKITNS